ncbi:MAG TPA: DUF4159 domain-containing protein [Thermoflexia bacterium]|nr:DUF4159 domain-containing protein [Thermoflexia bacterium]
MTTKSEILQNCSLKRLHPTDGMAVTAKVWAEAHAYHRLRQQAHLALVHGAGILSGLEVIASDPPDSTVYILPGSAISPDGELIIVPEPVTYNLGAAEGELLLWLTYAESQPRLESDPEAGERFYVHSQFGVEAQPIAVPVNGVELARVRRSAGSAAITDADNKEYPFPDELDLRFRQEIGVTRKPAARLGICYLGGEAGVRDVGVQALARALRHAGHVSLWVDLEIAPPDFGAYTLVYLVIQGALQVEAELLNTLYAYLQAGGTLFVEIVPATAEKMAASEAVFFEMLNSLGISLEPVKADHPLLTSPQLFAAPPFCETSPAESSGAPRLLEGDGVVFSRGNYGRLWGGQCAGSMPTRASIRASHEWGENLVAYALRRRAK